MTSKYFLNCFCAELFIQQIEVPESVFVGVKTRKYKTIELQNKNYKIASVEMHRSGVLNIQIQLFT